jgi:S-adenosylmethionine-diacylglycerol 3-amino-3-carboxypropyl transferase
MGLAHTINEKIFSRIHGNTLVYNTCWEDPRCDRAMLQINERSRVVVLTSAGCNALDYLLDNPQDINCVDLNPRQNALLQLKVAMLQGTDHATLFDFFGNGASTQAKAVLERVSPLLPDSYSQQYWQRNVDYFAGKGLRPSFYWRGSSGTVAWLVRKWLQTQPEARRIAQQLFEADSLETQRTWYAELEPRFLNRFVRWFVQQHVVQSMLGVPKSQQQLAAAYFDDGMVGYVRHCLRHVFTTLPVRDNYFWMLYFYGKYTPECCPNYLRPENFDLLRERSVRLKTHTTSLSGFLKANPGQYTHFILLDHQDWLAAHLQPALKEEWELILANSAPDAKVLLRSAAFDIDFIPEFARQRIAFDRPAAEASEKQDRVGTYASTWFGTITGA